MDYDLKNKIVLITGGGSGIGRASAVKAAQCGGTVVIAGRRLQPLKETQGLMNVGKDNVLVIQSDVSDPDSVKSLVDTCVERFGQLDCAFNNAGIDGVKAGLAETELEEWNKIIAINLTGTFLLMREEIPHMLRAGGGTIVNMASVCSLIARPGRSAYDASRSGVVGLTKTAALEYAAKGIRVNSIGPGSIKTDIFKRSTKGNPDLEKAYANAHPIKRVGEPEEIAEAVMWMFTGAPDFMVGHTLMVDGGLTLQ